MSNRNTSRLGSFAASVIGQNHRAHPVVHRQLEPAVGRVVAFQFCRHLLLGWNGKGIVLGWLLAPDCDGLAGLLATLGSAPNHLLPQAIDGIA